MENELNFENIFLWIIQAGQAFATSIIIIIIKIINGLPLCLFYVHRIYICDTYLDPWEQALHKHALCQLWGWRSNFLQYDCQQQPMVFMWYAVVIIVLWTTNRSSDNSVAEVVVVIAVVAV